MSNSFLIQANHPGQTIENCVRIIELLKLVDISEDGVGKDADMGQFMILREVSRALESIKEVRND